MKQLNLSPELLNLIQTKPFKHLVNHGMYETAAFQYYSKEHCDPLRRLGKGIPKTKPSRLWKLQYNRKLLKS